MSPMRHPRNPVKPHRQTWTDVRSVHTGQAVSSPLPKPMAVLLVDDDHVASDILTRELRDRGASVNVVHTIAGARSLLRDTSLRIDVVVVTTQLPDGSCDALLPDIEERPRQPALIIAGALLPNLDIATLEYRPVTVPKPVSSPALLRIIETVAGGYARPSLRRFIRRFGLSRRESEVTVLLAQGLRAKEIAAKMCCSEKTIYSHLFRICKKTGCRDSHEVVCTLLALTCHTMGHTPPDHAAFFDTVGERIR